MFRKITSLFLTLILIFAVGSFANAKDLIVKYDNAFLMLINQDYNLDSTYVPAGLVDLTNRVPSTKTGISLREDVLVAYEEMLAAYYEEYGSYFLVVSAYRDYNYQVNLFNSKLNSRISSGQSAEVAYANTAIYTAIPGTSEHQSGMTVDLSNVATLSESFAETQAGAWLLENCQDYGFINRYPAEKQEITKIANEPWHYRYVGLPHSQIIVENDWVLEEYIEYLRNEGSISYVDPNDENMVYDIYWTTDNQEIFPDEISFSRDNTGGYISTTYHENSQYYYAFWEWMEFVQENTFIMHKISNVTLF